MAKATEKTLQARVLVAHLGLGLQCGQIVKGPEPAINALASAGAVDPHPDAVAYAAEQGESVVELSDPAAAAELAV